MDSRLAVSFHLFRTCFEAMSTFDVQNSTESDQFGSKDGSVISPLGDLSIQTPEMQSLDVNIKNASANCNFYNDSKELYDDEGVMQSCC